MIDDIDKLIQKMIERWKLEKNLIYKEELKEELLKIKNKIDKLILEEMFK